MGTCQLDRLAALLPARRLAIAFVVAFVAACGGESSDYTGEECLPGVQGAGLRLGTIGYDTLSWTHELFRLGKTYTAPSTSQSVYLSGVISEDVLVYWSNSAGGDGRSDPVGIDCTDVGPRSCQTNSWGAKIPLQTGTNNIVVTATGTNRCPENISVTVIRQ